MSDQTDRTIWDRVVGLTQSLHGRLRRRLTSGVIVIAGILIVFVINSDSRSEYTNIASIFGKFPTLVTLALGLLVYATGTLVEIFCESIMSRIVGNLAWAYFVYRYASQRAISIRLLVVPFLAALAPFRKSIFHWPIHGTSENPEIGEQLLRGFPSSILEGISNPFGALGAIPWHYFTREEQNHSVRSFAQRLEARNSDLLVIATSFLVTSALLFMAYKPDISFLIAILPLYPPILVFLFCISVAILLWSLVGISAAYFVLLRNSFLALLKYRFSIRDECAPDPTPPEVLSILSIGQGSVKDGAGA